MANRRRILVFGVVFLLAGLAFGAAQKPFKVDVDLVMVNVAVTDNNRFVTDLKPDNFQLFEDKVEQKIEYFSTDVAPASLGIIFDLSHSMEKKVDFAREAVAKFLETGTPEDEYFLVEFSNRANLAEGFT